MDTVSSLPSLVFVPGAWHTSSGYAQVIKPLSSTFRCIPVDLPSVASQEGSPARKSWQSDIDAVRDVISAELDGGNSVVLVSHSYGSIPSQEAVQEFGETGKVKQVILAGFLLHEGESILGHNDGNDPPMWDIQGDVVFCKDPPRWFYNDLPEVQQNQLATQIATQTLISMTSPVNYAAWKRIPTTYVVCEKDEAIPPAAQRAMIAAAVEVGADIKVESLPASHSSFLSMPDRVVDIVRGVAGDSA